MNNSSSRMPTPLDKPDQQPDSPLSADEAELLRIYRDTVEPLYAYVARRCGGSQDLIEDITQEVFLRATIAWRKDGFPDEPLAWLKTVARNLLIKLYRKRKPHVIDPAVFNELIEQAKPPTSPESAALIHWGLGQLADRHARLIEAFHFDGRSTRQIAESDGLSVRAVEGRLHRARKALRKRLEPLRSHAGDAS